MSPLVVLVETIEERPHFPRLDQRHWQEIAGRMQTGDQKSHTPYPLAGWAPDMSRLIPLNKGGGAAGDDVTPQVLLG